MLGKFLYLFAAILAVSAVVPDYSPPDDDAPIQPFEGCPALNIGDPGFVARFYSYPISSRMGWDDGFFTGGYRTNLLQTVNRVTDFTFSYSNQPGDGVYYNNVYGYQTTTSNFTVELSGFFTAPRTGNFWYYLNADDGASLFLGSANDCCIDASDLEPTHHVINTLKRAVESDTNRANMELVFLEKGLYYPVKIVAFNSNGNSNLTLGMADEDGNILEDLGSYFHQLEFPAACEKTMTSLWDGAYETTTTMTGESANTVVVEIPKARTTTTATWTGTATVTSTVTGKSTNTLVVNVPSVPTTTITSVWTGASTVTTTVLGATDTVVVQIPKAKTTTTSFWDSSYTTTLTVTGELADTIVVDSPKPSGYVEGCNPSKILGDGFDVSFYKYPLGNNNFREDPEFFNGGYKQFGYLDTVHGVQAINFATNSPSNEVDYDQIYGYTVSVTNFSFS